MTHDERELGLVSFCQMIPVALIGPFAGSLSDMLDKRRLLIVAQLLFGVTACALAYVTYTGQVTVWHIRACALLFGVIGTFETPTRQTIVSRVVPPEELAQAIPVNAMTFNLARVLGSAIGGIMLNYFGEATCFLANGISYLALIGGALMIKSDLSATALSPQPIKDLLLEGMRYTFRHPRLRVLFVLESILSSCGLIYLPLMPSYVESTLGLKQASLGYAMTFVGIGAMVALVFVSTVAQKPYKIAIVRGTMIVMGLTLAMLGFVKSTVLAFCLFPVLGFCSIAHFNVMNTLFQTLAPDRLRGRVVSMHVWAVGGLAPFASLGAGWIGKHYTVGTAYFMGGSIVLLAGCWSLLAARTLDHVEARKS